MHASMPCAECGARRPCGQALPPPWLRSLLLLLLLPLLLLLALPAQAHKASDAYLRLAAIDSGAGTGLRVDVALRDLDAALDLDADADGRLTWGEVKAAWPVVDGHLRRHVELAGCRFDPALSEPLLERRSDGVYAVLRYRSGCTLPAEPVLRYTLLADVDSTHRGLLVVERAGAAGEVRVLDPQPAGCHGG